MITEKRLTVEDDDGDTMCLSWEDVTDDFVYITLTPPGALDNGTGACIRLTPEDAAHVAGFLRQFYLMGELKE
jgi:hypothetical protein